MRTILGLLASSALLAPPAMTQVATDTATKDPTNTLPLVTTRNARFTTDEGTWMSVDVSPDGSTIVFDLLGDIYTMPISGGKATRIIGGNSIDVQPRFSPDGKQLVFISDRGGSDATWIADADGKRLRQLATGGAQPVWTPDGKSVLVGNRLVNLRGGAGVQLQGVGSGASFTADGRYLWYQTGSQANRYDLKSGKSTYHTNLPGGALRPMISRDGKSLLYVTRYEAKGALVLRDVETGVDRWILTGLKDDGGASGQSSYYFFGPAQQGSTIGALPGAAWVPNGSAIVASQGGKLWRIDIPSGQMTAIPFTADVDQALGPLVKFEYKVGDSVTVREVRDPSLSPDGRRVAFSAFGKVWVSDFNGGTPRRLTKSNGVVEGSPIWTPDGRSVTYVTWVDNEGGDIYQVGADGGSPNNLTKSPGFYARLNYTPDGSKLVFTRGPRRARTLAVVEPEAPSNSYYGPRGKELNLELRWMPAKGGAQKSIITLVDIGTLPAGGLPHFGSDTSRVYIHDGKALVSFRWDGSDRKVVIANASPNTLLSPDGVHVLTQAGGRRHIYVYELPQPADSLVFDPTAEGNAPLPARRLTKAGGDFPRWSRDGGKAVWAVGPTIFVYDVKKGEAAIADSLAKEIAKIGQKPDTAKPDSAKADTTKADSTKADTTKPAKSPADTGNPWAPVYQADRYQMKIAIPAEKPSGVVALRGARIVTMKGNEVIDNGVIVITDNRITAVGAAGQVSVPSNAKVIDVSGKTIIPGYVDTHAKIAAPNVIHRTLVSQYLANLAFGVTTTRDPETQSSDIFSYADRVAIGELLGPRIFTTGPAILESTLGVRTMADGNDFVAPYATVYRTNTIRGDMSSQRPNRHNFLKVANELRLTPVSVASADFKRSLTEILDGYPDHQGSYEVNPIYGDVAQLIAISGTTYTPMFLGKIGSRSGFDYAVATEDPHANAKLRRFSYHDELDTQTRGNLSWVAPEEYQFESFAGNAARILSAGGKVALGSNGAIQGLALHWEMWLLSKGGVSNQEILRAATSSGAEVIGLGSELGSIEVGKLADLQVLDRDPLADIRNTVAIRYVMINGRLYDAGTLDQVAPVSKKLPRLWWWDNEQPEGTR